MTVSEAFNKFLPNNFNEAIQHQFGDNPEELIQGVNYWFEGKIWNVRIGLNKNEEDVVTDLFIRAYCKSEAKVYHFSNVHYVQKASSGERKKSINYNEYKITSSSSGNSSGTVRATRELPTIIPSIIRNGVKDHSRLTPRLGPPLGTFQLSWVGNHQELVPPIHRATSRRPETTPTDRTSYFLPVTVG